MEPPRKVIFSRQTVNQHTAIQQNENPEGESEDRNIIDYVLVYKMHALNQEQQLKLLTYERSLLLSGLSLRTERYKDMSFLKISVSKPTLYQYAELLRLRMPLKWEDVFATTAHDTHDDLMQRFLSFLSIESISTSQKICTEFSRDKLYLFDQNDPDFFNQSARISIAAYIIARAPFGDPRKAGIKALILDKTILDAYPLHDGTMTTKDSVRYHLNKNWASWRCWYKVQPLNEIREYFGCGVALYFTWLGFYSKMLIPVSIGGIVATLIGMSFLHYDGYSKDLCSCNVTMCPICDNFCPYWNLQSACMFGRLSVFTDNYFTITFSWMMTLWNVLYVVLWKRHMRSVTYNWGLANHNITAEPTRPEYLNRLAHSKRQKVNVLTLTLEPEASFWGDRVPIVIFSGTVVLLWLFFAIFLQLGLLFYRTDVRKQNMQHLIKIEIIFTAIDSGFNLLLTYLLYFFYKKCALRLTHNELHRTNTQHEDSLFLKLYAFQFVTHYTHVVYLMIIKRSLVRYPGNHLRITGWRSKECILGGCMFDVMVYITLTMTGKQVVYLVVARYLPVLKTYKCKIRAIFNNIFKCREPDHYNQVVDDFKLLTFRRRQLYMAYLDNVQFGFVSLFISAFPLAYVFALVSNTIRIRVDALRILKYYKRSVPEIVKDIGVWLSIVRFITRLSILTNAIIIAQSPRFIPTIVFYYEGLSDKLGNGCLLNTLSKFDTKDLEPGTAPEAYVEWPKADYCYYFGFKEPPEAEYKYTYSTFYWKVLAGQLVFVIVYYVIAIMLITIVQWTIPHVPTRVEEKMQIEEYHVNRAIMREEKKNK